MYTHDYMKVVGIPLSTAISVLSPVVIIIVSRCAAKHYYSCGMARSRVIGVSTLIAGCVQFLLILSAIVLMVNCIDLKWALNLWIAITVIIFICSHLMLISEKHTTFSANDSSRYGTKRYKLILMIVSYLQFVSLPLTIGGTNPGVSEHRTKSPARQCIKNMRNIDAAVNEYHNSHTVAIESISDLFNGHEPKCSLAAGKSYIITNSTVICPVVDQYGGHHL